MNTAARYVVFGLGSELFAVAVETVHEILPLPAVTPVPGAPDWLLGVFNRRGDIMSVVDVRRRLRCAERPTGPQSRLVVVATSKYTLAVLVDSVEEIAMIAPEDTIAAEAAGIEGRNVSRAALRGGRLVSFIDLEPILTCDEFLAYQ